MTFLVIRSKRPGVKPKIRDTMSMLNLSRVNHAVLIPETPAYAGMLQKVKDYVTWGEIEADTIASLLKERGRMTGDKPVTDAGIKAGSEYSTIKALAKAIAAGDARTNESRNSNRSSACTLRGAPRAGAASSADSPSAAP
ncbi:MAG: hypothetical protein Ct9H300mP30_0310 [Methanobacteriota archaeon]|nr:MAG: hypothetical protein Ct9H300mP30_0310 [Euryarchaeota archaeon]